MTSTIGIIGSGFGGLAAAIELERNGIDYVVLERGESVGGTWRDNTYPGAACDVPSSIYQYSFELNSNWKSRFGSQREIHAYLKHCADKYGVAPKIRFGAEVVAATWNESNNTWTVDLAGGETLEFAGLITATGQLSNPKVPDLPGISEFRGEQFHSAQWRHDVDLTGKRVVVVGSGASAVQVVPAIVDQVAHLTVVQRSPNWILSKHDHDCSGIVGSVLRNVPGLGRAHHDAEWMYYETRYPLVLNAIDPVRPAVEAYAKARIARHIPDPELRAKVTPNYKVGCNRTLISNDWYRTLARPDVDVVAAGVEKILPDGLVASDGTTVDADVIIWCTGFGAGQYLAPMKITGRDGRVLRDEWQDAPEAYLGVSVSGYPNLFMIYGPNTNSLTNTVIYLLERQAAYARKGIEKLRPGSAFDVRAQVQADYNEWLQRRLGGTVFSTGCPGWYTSADGKIVAMWPGSHIEYGRAVATFDESKYAAL